jgi:hypothetical protein
VSVFYENMKLYFTLENLLTLSLDLDPDPELDPDLHSSIRLDQDPHIMIADPKYCLELLLSKSTVS